MLTNSNFNPQKPTQKSCWFLLMLQGGGDISHREALALKAWGPEFNCSRIHIFVLFCLLVCLKPGMVAYSTNLNTRDTETGR